MADKKKTGFGRLAKRRVKTLKLSVRYRDDGDLATADRYVELAAEMERRLRAARVCIACGRPLKNEESLLTGLGPECTAKIEEEANADR